MHTHSTEDTDRNKKKQSYKQTKTQKIQSYTKPQYKYISTLIHIIKLVHSQL